MGKSIDSYIKNLQLLQVLNMGFCSNFNISTEVLNAIKYEKLKSNAVNWMTELNQRSKVEEVYTKGRNDYPIIREIDFLFSVMAPWFPKVPTLVYQ